MIRYLLASLLLVAACSNQPVAPADEPAKVISEPYDAQYHDAARALNALKTLSSDAYEGRRTGEPGNVKAQAWIVDRLQEMLVFPYYSGGFQAPFAAGKFDEPDLEVRGTNIVAEIEGTNGRRSRVIVMSAHYDHLGMLDGDIYNGADDNASGVAALLEAIAWFQENPPENTIVFTFFDAEEQGFAGSAFFVRAMPESLRERMALNLNLDMVARADKGELYAVGGHHNPELIPLIDGIAEDAPITLKRGHDSPEWGDQDWTLQSDHAPFLRAGFPIIYLGVEDHPDYHRPSDTFEKVDPDTFARITDTIIMMAEAADDWVAEQPKE
ncbi:MAG: M20/M25/M40 family metallo-hydrolase [Henriciella sp.]|uniref:M20/M25/M40 family metallo-hydrolase n=1 Tax=Henriciella sp. TaxID=1968823 RepID=UPI0032EDAA05